MSADAPLVTPVGLPRRFGAMLYDGLLLIALLMVAEFLIVAPFAITEEHPLFMTIHLYVPLLAFAFLGWFWTCPAGQTLGMQAWHVRLVDMDGGRADWGQAAIRFAVALAQWIVVLAAIALYVKGWWIAALPLAALVMVGLMLARRDPQRLMLHDRLSGTRLVRVK
ncbi:RDD family protein [Thioalkalivibrio sulfidiphilus]|uniref:RDD family protein n=1 Tax=Thioalkalivibrio sulfidiphilus TaxID=1033854 RepID=UPI003B348B4D